MSTQRRSEPHPFVSYADASHICKHCDGGDFAACHQANTIRQQSRAVRNMPSLNACTSCGLSYYQTSAPHVCAEWARTKKENEINNDTTGYPVMDQILKTIAPTPLSELCRYSDDGVTHCGLMRESHATLANHLFVGVDEDEESPMTDADKIAVLVRATGEETLIGALRWIQKRRNEHEPVARGGENDGSKRYLLSEIKHFITENGRLRQVLEVIRDSYWSENEPYSERVEHLQQLAKDALNDQKGE